MFIITSIYFAMLFLIFWSYCGYSVLLSILDIIAPQPTDKNRGALRPLKIAVFIPCLNDEAYVEQKVGNLKSLVLPPGEVEFFFLCGLSTDSTNKKIAELIWKEPAWHLIETGCVGKVNQLNYGLSMLQALTNDGFEIIMGTDMDASLSQDVLLKFAEAFNSDARVGVVGANVSPNGLFPIEEAFWRDQNLMRILENNICTSSIVVAPCFAYRRKLLDRFPSDCVADDIHIAFKANSSGYLTKYLKDAAVTELRTPVNFEDFFRHKFRKGNAYLIELFRFLYQLPHMQGWWKMIYSTRLIQMALMPWILFYFLLATISLALSGWGLGRMAWFGTASLFISLVITHFMLLRARAKYFRGTAKTSHGIVPFVASNFILILVGLSYPFYKQTSNYSKITPPNVC